METISAEARKIPVLASVHFKKSGIEASRKKLLEHFTAIFGILSDKIL